MLHTLLFLPRVPILQAAFTWSSTVPGALIGCLHLKVQYSVASAQFIQHCFQSTVWHCFYGIIQLTISLRLSCKHVSEVFPCCPGVLLCSKRHAMAHGVCEVHGSCCGDITLSVVLAGLSWLVSRSLSARCTAFNLFILSAVLLFRQLGWFQANSLLGGTLQSVWVSADTTGFQWCSVTDCKRLVVGQMAACRSKAWRSTGYMSLRRL